MSDLMLLGVLRMPAEMVREGIAFMQFVGRAHQAADRIEADAAEIEALRTVVQNTMALGLITEDQPLLLARARAALEGTKGCGA